MDVGSWLETLADRVRQGARGAWSNGARTHLQVRAVDDEDVEAFAASLCQALEAVEGVRWARYNGYLGRVVVEHVSGIEREALLEAIEAAEEQANAGEELARPDPAYGGSCEPERRTWVELGADAASLLVSAALRMSGDKASAFDIDVAALVTAVEGIPRVKQSMERSLSRQAADLTLELTKAWSQVLTRSETGPVGSLLKHGLKLREARARGRVWSEREVELCSDPDVHVARRARRKERPAPLQRGPIERYDEAAVPASLVSFGAGMFFSRDLSESAPALFAGLPRAARQGRMAFAAHLGWLLAERGVLVIDGDALRLLDRMSVMVLPEELARRDDEDARRLARCARARGVAVRVAGPSAAGLAWLDEEEALCTHKKLSKVVRRLQRSGAGVMVVADGPSDGFRAADLGLSLSAQPPPWGAHVIARHGWADAELLLDAVRVARRASEHGVGLAVMEAATGLVLTMGGLRRRTTQRVMSLANTASILSMANGVRLSHGLRRPVPAPPTEVIPYHAMDPTEVLAHLQTSAAGLDAHEAARRRPEPPAPAGRLQRTGRAVLEELANPMTPVLGLGAVMSASVGSVVDAGLILAAVGIDAAVGGAQRSRAQRAIEALEAQEERTVRALREGAPIPVRTSDLSVGDVVRLEAGEIVPADCRILSATGLQADEAALTGESLPVDKAVEAVEAAHIAERRSMLYAGTSVAAGQVEAVVVAVGADTEMGRARAGAWERTDAGGVEARLSSLSGLTLPVAAGSALVMLGSGLARGRPFDEVVGAAVGLGVASVPEGLPILSTLAQLAAGRRLSDRGVLVRNPRALEPLGRVDVLCCDKTGTLTEGSIRLAVVADGKRRVPVQEAKGHLAETLAVAVRATPRRQGRGELAHATDEALLSGCARVSVQESSGLRRAYERRHELPFEPGRGWHATLGIQDGRAVVAVKGAPETLLPLCSSRRCKKRVRDMSKADRRKLLKEARALGRRGFRVLAVAERDAGQDEALEEGAIRRLTFRGFVGFADPVRSSARAAIEDLADAGVRVVMLTGDHPSTARAIAEDLALPTDEPLTGDELDALDEDALASRLERVRVIARVTPAQKVRLVRALQRRGLTVGMTGDGANDAAAISLADVGIAVGSRSTAAARGAADLVVTDDRLETIVDAVLEGRALWRSVRDAVSVLVGGNLGEIAFTVASGLITGRSPLNTRQLLLVNLITDTLPALAIAVQPPKRAQIETLLAEGPEASLGTRLERDLWTRAAVTAGAAGLAQLMARLGGCSAPKASTVGLLGLTGAQLGQTLLIGGADPRVLGAGVGSIALLLGVVETPGVSHFFGCRPLGPIALGQALSASAAATAAAWWIGRRADLRAGGRRATSPAPAARADRPQPAPPFTGPFGVGIEPDEDAPAPFAGFAVAA